MNTLWIEKYRPASFDELLGQQPAANVLKACAEAENLPHLMVIGKSGTGKSAALEIFSRMFYAEAAAENTTILPVSVMFTQGHAYLEGCERFAHLYDKGKSVLANFKYIVKWHASLKPLSAPFRIVIFDGAGDLPKDAQAALRRIMERYSATCRFIFVTSSAASIIDPIRSRCVPLYFLPIEYDVIRTKLSEILKAEGKEDAVTSDMLDMISLSANGDLRRAEMYLELAACYGVSDPAEFTKNETAALAGAALEAAGAGDVKSAQETMETMMAGYGMTASEVLSHLRKTLHGNLTPETALVFANADVAIREGQNEYLQINAFAAELTNVLGRR
ncbi:MAG TPA: replication protein C [Methanocorpusculum sp.]|nr:replication protein C [Methanocorpusculum sp.]